MFSLPIPGDAIPTLLRTTAMIPCLAATFDSPILLPLLSTTGTPSWISLKFTIKIRNHPRHDNQKQHFQDKKNIQQFLLHSHHGNVDTIGSGNGSKWHKAANQCGCSLKTMLETCLEAGTLRRRLFQAYFDHAVQAQSSDQRTSSSQHI